jgi:glutamyl-tRNA reductase
MSVFVAGLSYKTAPVELREQLAITPSQLGCHGCRLRIVGGLDEVVLLSTCNRVEIYGVSPSVNGNVKSLFQLLSKYVCDVRDHLYVHEGAAAIGHLFSVASGLDSMVLGETEITGQVKHAYEAAQAARLTGATLNRVFQKAFQAAKEIRTSTAIGRGATSVGSVAVELAEKIFRHGLSQHTVMIIGAGKMGEACVRHLAKKGAQSILVSNRSFDRAQALATEFNGQAIRFDDCLTRMADVDIVVSSTGCPQTILHRTDVEKLMQTRRNRPLFLIDIAVPRDIDPGVQRIDNVYLYNIDDLEAIVRQNVHHRERELAQCRAIIEKQTAALMAKLKWADPADPMARPSKTEKETNDACIQSQPDWLSDRAAVIGS